MDCPLIKDSKIGLSKDGRPPCELCALIEKLGGLVTQASKEIRALEPVQHFDRMKKEYNKIAKAHKTCAGCGLCFGGYHIAFPMRFIPKLGQVCQWCAENIDKHGIEHFRERIKGHENENL